MKRFLCLGTLVLAIVAVAPLGAAAQELTSFMPRLEKMLIQLDSSHPELPGETRLDAIPGAEGVEDLERQTGQTDFIAVGSPGQQVVFRDDGEFGDRVKGDGVYSAIVDIDHTELAERAGTERTNESNGENVVPVFEGRAIVGQAEVKPFDIDSFNAGKPVVLERSLSISGGSASPSPETEEGAVRSVTAAAVVPGTNQFQERVLMIRNAAVVQDPLRTFDPCTSVGTPMGAWTFGHLVTEMANQPATGINPSTFAETWLLHWAANQNINSFNVPPRFAMQALINDWRAASGGGDLNLKIAPFRLLAINPRIDLRTTSGGSGGYAGVGTGNFLDAGEARFTFGIILPKGYDKSQAEFNFNVGVPGTSCQVTRFSVIFEYRVPKCKCEDVRDWARNWRRLNTFVPGTANYNGLLEKLTRTFTDANANPTRSNRSAIGQVRSNEIALAIPWEIREFQLRMMPWSFLLETTTADSPDDGFNNTALFGNFVLDVMNGVAGPPVPLFYPLGSPNNFLGANPQTPNPGTTFWNAPNLNVLNPPEDAARHNVSLGTCNGCHARETNTIFQHIESFQTAPPAVLSQFLTGTVPPVIDPAGSGTVREFDDLARRELDINAVARMLCGQIQPIRVSPIRIPPIGPVRSDGGEVQSVSAAATASPDPEAPPLSIAIDDFLREPVTQVH